MVEQTLLGVFFGYLPTCDLPLLSRNCQLPSAWLGTSTILSPRPFHRQRYILVTPRTTSFWFLDDAPFDLHAVLLGRDSRRLCCWSCAHHLVLSVPNFGTATKWKNLGLIVIGSDVGLGAFTRTLSLQYLS